MRANRYSHIVSREFEQSANKNLLHGKKLPVHEKRQGKYHDLAPYTTTYCA